MKMDMNKDNMEIYLHNQHIILVNWNNKEMKMKLFSYRIMMNYIEMINHIAQSINSNKIKNRVK